MTGLAEEMARLAGTSLRGHPEFVGEDAFVPAATAFYGHLREAAGSVEAYRRDGRLAAFFVAWHEADAALGLPVTHGIVHADLADPAALAWAQAYLERHYPTLADDLLLELDAAYGALLPALVARGYRVDSVALGQTLGGAMGALAALPDRPLPPGLALRPLADEADVEAVVALQRVAYTETPEFCWHGATEGSLAAVRQGLREGLEGRSPHFVLVDGPAVVGYVGASVMDANLYWGPCAVGDVVFANAVRGRGLLAPCARHLLAHLEAAGVRTVLAPTAQRPVMDVARRLGARPLAWMVRKASPFPPGHFDLAASSA